MSNARAARFPRGARLLSAEQYSRVFAAAIRSSDSYFTVLARRNDGKLARLGLAIAKKHLRLATARNRIKRQARESFRANLTLVAGLDIIVLAKPMTGKYPNYELRKSLERHWRRLRDQLQT